MDLKLLIQTFKRISWALVILFLAGIVLKILLFKFYFAAVVLFHLIFVVIISYTEPFFYDNDHYKSELEKAGEARVISNLIIMGLFNLCLLLSSIANYFYLTL